MAAIRTNLAFFLIILFLIQCGSKKEVDIDLSAFDSDVSQSGNIVFKFNRNLVEESELNQWQSTTYATFEPEIRGSFMWRNQHELWFSPEGSLPPATKYKVKLSDKITEGSVEKVSLSTRSFEFNTTRLQVESISGYWKKAESGGDIRLYTELRFNHKVDASEIKEKASVQVDGEDKSIVLVTEGSAKNIILQVSDISAGDDDIRLNASLKSGVVPTNGNIPKEDETSQEILVPSTFKVNVDELLVSHDGLTGQARISFSQPISVEDFRKSVEIDPKIKFEVQSSNNEILVSSEAFDISLNYQLTIKAGLKGSLGGKLKRDYSNQLIFGKLQPEISFVDKNSRYLSRKGARNIEIALVSVDKVYVEIYKLYANNMQAFFSSSYYEYNYDYDEYSWSYNYSNIDQYGDLLTSELVKTAKLPGKGGKKILKIDFEDKLGEYDGVYIVRVQSEDEYYLRDHKTIVVSDLGLIVKEGVDEISVFANSVSTAAPIGGATIDFVGSNNQKLGSAVTDQSGYASLKTSDLPASGFKVNLITASLGDDFNMLSFRDTQVNTSKFETGGRYTNSSNLDIFPFSERNIYRPGEEVNLAAIIRNNKWEIPPQMPLKINIVSPTGNELFTFRKIVNDKGSISCSFRLPETALTGYYDANIYTGNDVYLKDYSFQVEEFLPDRIKVETSLNKESYVPDEDIIIDVQALNLFGPPAANRNAEINWQIRHQNFYSRDYNTYDFSLWPNQYTLLNNVLEDETDAEGKVSQRYTVPEDFANRGLLKAELYTTVFDETGRPVSRKETADIHTQERYLGAEWGSYYIPTNRTHRIKLVAVDKEGKAAEQQNARIKLIRYDYKTVLARSGSYYRYRSEKETIVLQDKDIDISGTNTSFDFAPDVSGEYELQLYMPGADYYVRKSIYAYGFGNTSRSSFQVDRDGNIDIKLDKEKYEVGEKAKVLLTTPFAGTLLITVESDKVLKHFYMPTDERSASFELDIEEQFLPSIYVSATLFKPHQETEFPLTVAHGIQRLKVEQPSNRLALSIEAEERSRSNQKQKIRVKTESGTEVAIAVVDEGILQLTGFATPDPYNTYYGARALEVTSYDIYPYLFPEINSSASKTGGDGELDEALTSKRLNPLANKRVKLVSYWSDWQTSDGSVEFDIDIPQFSGSLRVMAVAHKKGKFGSESQNIQVADPLVTSVGLPRFFSPGDSVFVPVTLSNTTSGAAISTTKIEIEGGLQVSGDKSQKAQIPANSESKVGYSINVSPNIGQAKVMITTDALGEQFVNETDITIRPASPLIQNNGSGIIQAGKQQNISIDVLDFIPESIDKKLVLAKTPLVQFSDDLNYLVRYPYGCVEQTVSAVFPQLYIKDIMKNILDQDMKSKDPNHNINTAIRKLMLMQLYNGGLTYWPGQGSESWWGSVYAAHFLVEAQKAGYEVNQSFLNKLLDYLKNRLNDKSKIDYYYNGNLKKKIVPRAVPYSLYVLALAGKPNTSAMNYHSSNVYDLSLDGRYMLAASYYLSGNRSRFESILPKAFDGEKANSSFSGSFYSYMRDEAMALNMLLETDPQNLQIPVMTRHISEQLKNRRYINTQERAFSLLALGKLAKRSNDSNVKAEVTANGKKIADYDNETITLNTNDLTANAISISTSGDGELYYFWETEGISASGIYPEEDEYLKVRRSFYDRNGRRITNGTFSQNDLVVVKIQINSLTNTYVENVAISDILPAGFEVENPRISDLPNMTWIKDKSFPEHSDIRDDRVNLFVNVGSRVQNYYYMLRVVSKGKFILGPIGAEAMYNGEYHSYHGAGEIIVK
ncbi:MAG: MG2 domain-containing protein [Bacteroidota bacterium]